MPEQLRVLILEDRPPDAKLMVHELQRAGFDLYWQRVDTEADYVTQLQTGWDVILADGGMPGFDAVRAMALLKERGLEVPVIVVTGSISDERAVEYMKNGAADYLLKDHLAWLGQAVVQVREKWRLRDEKRRIEEERARFFTLSLDLLCVAGLDGFFKQLNPAWEAVLGWSTEELLAQSYLYFVHPDDHAATSAEEKRLARGEQTLAFENRYRCKNGAYKWLSWRATPDLARRLIYGTARDTTQQRRAELQFRNLVESAPYAMVIVNLHGEIVLINSQTEALFDYHREELLGKPVEILLPERHRDKHVDHRQHFMDAPRVRRMGAGLELSGRRKGGREFPVEISLSPLETEEGTLIFSAIRDITENKRLEAQVIQAQKMEAIGKLAGGVAHDFNNLLTIINGYGDILLGQFPANDPRHELLREMTKAGARAASLTRQLLSFSRRQVVAPKILDIREVVADTEKMLRRLIGEDIQLRITNDAALWTIKADPGQIEQVLLNLAINARDAMPTGGKLAIETRNIMLDGSHPETSPEFRPGPHVLLSVSDTGTGMGADTKAHIFEPFFTTKGEKGTGLGLATVYSIVKQSDGHLQVESEPGRGATFRVYFPATKEKSPLRKSSQGTTTLSRGSETILLVEDEEAVRYLGRHVLASCGYKVLEAGNGLEALEVAEKYRESIHLVVTDVVMPEMSGREMRDRLVQLHPETRVLFVSGYTDDAVVLHGVRETETAFLQKPFTGTVLAHKVREVLEQD